MEINPLCNINLFDMVLIHINYRYYRILKKEDVCHTKWERRQRQKDGQF